MVPEYRAVDFACWVFVFVISVVLFIEFVPVTLGFKLYVVRSE